MGGIGNQRAQLSRMSLLVPFLIAHPESSLGELAAEFDTTIAQIGKDLTTLSFCGLPGQGMGDLIEVVYDGDRVTITESAGIERPLQLTAPEASSLVIALRSMLQSPGSASYDTILSALAKLENAVGSRVESPVALNPAPTSELTVQLRDALQRERAVELDYWTPSRDEVSHRTVDPITVFRVDDVDYLEAWCRSAEAPRTFRVDRMSRLQISDQPLERHDSIARDLAEGVYSPSEDDLHVKLEVTRAGHWVAEYYDTTAVTELPSGGATIELSLGRESLERLVTQLGTEGLAPQSDPQVAAAVRAVSERSRVALARYSAPGA